MKNYLFKYWIFSLSIALLVSCSSRGKLTRRYKSFKQDNINEKIGDFVKVSGYALETDAVEVAKAKTIFDLSPNGQKELIRQAGLHESKSDAFINLIKSPLSSKAQNDVEIIDYTKFQKRIVISVKKLGNAPADRINKIDIDLNFSENVKLLSCNRLTTEYQNIDLGKVNYSNSTQGNLSANLTSGLTSVLSSGVSNTGTVINSDGTTFTGSDSGTSATTGNSNTNVNGNTSGLSNTVSNGQGVNASLSGTRSYAEEVLLKQRIVGLQVSLRDNTLNLYQDGTVGIDLSGNIIADVIFEIKKDVGVAIKRIISFSDLKDTNGTYQNSNKIKVKEILAYYPELTNPIDAKISYYAEYRNVLKGDGTISESDDDVLLKLGKMPEGAATVALIPIEQLKPKLWKLYLTDNVVKAPIQIFTPSTNNYGDLIFNSASEAINFNLWLKSNFSTILNGGIGNVGHKLMLPNGAAINSVNVSKLVVGIY